jgi:hypothetical protein
MNLKMKKLITILLFMVAGYCGAGEVTASIGVTHFNSQHNGIWYQKGLPHTLKLTSASYGLEWMSGSQIDDWQFGVAYTYVGKAKSHALATPSDDNYDNKANKCIGECWPLAKFNTEGTVQGLSFVARRNFNKWFIEGGLMLEKPTNDVVVDDWYCCLDQASTGRHRLNVRHNSKIIPLPQASIGYREGNYSIKFNVFPTSATGDEWQAVFNLASPNISIGYTF